MYEPSNLPPDVTDRMIEEQESGENDVAYAQVMNRIESEKQQLIGWIVSYIVAEDFPQEHLRALKKIICRFNWNEESEQEIFEFAEMIDKKYSEHS